MSHAIEHNKRVIAFKNREQGLRSRALGVNEDHNRVQISAMKEMKIHQDLQHTALTEPVGKATHDLPNYSRSSHHYVSLPDQLLRLLF